MDSLDSSPATDNTLSFNSEICSEVSVCWSDSASVCCARQWFVSMSCSAKDSIRLFVSVCSSSTLDTCSSVCVSCSSSVSLRAASAVMDVACWVSCSEIESSRRTTAGGTLGR